MPYAIKHSDCHDTDKYLLHASQAIHVATLVATFFRVHVKLPCTLKAAHAAVTTLERVAEAMFGQQVITQPPFALVRLAAYGTLHGKALQPNSGTHVSVT